MPLRLLQDVPLSLTGSELSAPLFQSISIFLKATLANDPYTFLSK